MAAGPKRNGAKTCVFWSEDDDLIDERVVKVLVPGLSLEPPKVKQPMVRKPVHMQKAQNSTLQKPVREQEIRHGANDAATVTSQHLPNEGKRTLEDKGGGQELTLKDLNPQDKKRVANLVRELAKVGEEREVALERLGKERSAFEERLQILQEEYNSVTREKEYMQKRFIQLQSLLKKYNHQGTRDKGGSSRKTVGVTNQRAELVQTPADQRGPQTPGTASVPKRGSQSFLERIPGNKRHVSERSSDPREVHSPATQAIGSPSDDGRENQPDQRQLHEKSNEEQGRQKKQGKEEQQQQQQQQQQQHKQQQQQQQQQQHQDKQQQQRQDLQRPEPLGTFQEQQHEQLQSSMNLASEVFKGGAPVLPSFNEAEPVTARGSHESATRGGDLGNDGGAVGASRPGRNNGKPWLTTSTQTHVPLAEKSQSQVQVHHPIPVTYPYPGKPLDAQSRDRSYSESSAVSQNFSAELDAVYRLYCREYELQLQLQQQQLELQRQQLQLQQQLQQMELLQHQQLTRTLPLVTDQVNNPRHGQTVVMETPTPSSAPKPAVQPRPMSPAATLDPTPDVLEVLAADSSQTELAGPRVSRVPSREGYTRSCPEQPQGQRLAVSRGRQVRDQADALDSSKRGVPTSSFTSPPLSKNSRDLRVIHTSHQDEALLDGHSSYGLAGRQSLPLFECSVEPLVPDPVRSVSRSSVDSSRSLQCQRECFTVDVNGRKSKPAVQRVDQGKENFAPIHSSQFGAWTRPPSSITSNRSLVSLPESRLEQGQQKSEIDSVRTLTERRALLLPPGTAPASVARNFSFYSDGRGEDACEHQKSTRWNRRGDQYYSLYEAGDVNKKVPDASGQNDGQLQDTRFFYPRSVIDLVQDMESITAPGDINSETNSSFESHPMPLRRPAFDEDGRSGPTETISLEDRDRSLREKFGGGLDEDLEETRLLENIFFVSDSRR